MASARLTVRPSDISTSVLTCSTLSMRFGAHLPEAMDAARCSLARPLHLFRESIVSPIIFKISIAAGSNNGRKAFRMLEYSVGNTPSSRARSFLMWLRSFGASKHAGQFSLMTGKPAS